VVAAGIAAVLASVSLLAQVARVSAPPGVDAKILAELGGADLLVLIPRAGSAVLLAERTIVEALGSRRGVVLAFALLGRAVEDPLSHFQMGHVTDDELRVEANISPAEWRRYKPLLDLAVARKWPIVPSGEGAVGPEIERTIRTASSGGRPLAIYVARSDADPSRLTVTARKQLPGARVFSFLLADRRTARPAADYVLVP
jgi:hypothetical protein